MHELRQSHCQIYTCRLDPFRPGFCEAHGGTTLRRYRQICSRMCCTPTARLLIVLTLPPCYHCPFNGYRPLRSCSRAAGWSAATLCPGPSAKCPLASSRSGQWGHSGLDLLTLSFSHFDPTETLPAPLWNGHARPADRPTGVSTWGARRSRAWPTDGQSILGLSSASSFCERDQP
jgi:hypothetical protein